MTRNENLTSKLMSEVTQVNDYSVSPLERMKQDSSLRWGDFIPYFGEKNYKTRTLPHQFASIFLDTIQAEKEKPFLEQMKSREGLLESYNNTLMIVAGMGIIYGINLLSRL